MIRPPLAVAAVMLLAGLGAVRLAHVYSLPDAPPDPKAEAQLAVVRGFLGDALAGDSVALAARSAGAGPVVWALAAARGDSALLRAWLDGATSHDFRSLAQGDTTFMIVGAGVHTPSRCAYLGEITAALVPVAGKLKIARLRAPCLADSLAPPIEFRLESPTSPGPPAPAPRRPHPPAPPS